MNAFYKVAAPTTPLSRRALTAAGALATGAVFAVLRGHFNFLAYAIKTMWALTGVFLVLLVLRGAVTRWFPSIPELTKRARRSQEVWASSPLSVRTLAALVGALESTVSLLTGALMTLVMVAFTIKLLMR
jgi:hypothetical protein